MTTSDPIPQVYEELRRLAEHYMQGERPGHTLSATALVHEAYVRLSKSGEPGAARDRSHYLALAATCMRRILVDLARARQRQKRGGKDQPITLDEGIAIAQGRPLEVLAVDEALNRLAELHPRHARVVELRFFAQMTFPEMSEVLGYSVRTLKEDWKMARLWLLREIDPGPAEG